MVTRRQLLDAGLSPEAIRHRVEKGRLWRVYPDVFALGRPELPREGRWIAAVLACGERAALSHLSAAALWGIWGGVAPGWPQVSVPTRAGRRGPRGIDLHRAGTLTADDITTRNAIPVTTLPRTLLDVTATLSPKQLRGALRQSERLHDVDLRQVRHSLGALPPSNPRRARLTRALDTYGPGMAATEGEPEAEFLELCAKYGLPLPACQFPIGPYRADFAWPDIGLVVEVDDRGSHDGFVAFREDRVRDRVMKGAGFEVLRFTSNEVAQTAREVARELRTARARRAVR